MPPLDVQVARLYCKRAFNVANGVAAISENKVEQSTAALNNL